MLAQETHYSTGPLSDEARLHVLTVCIYTNKQLHTHHISP